MKMNGSDVKDTKKKNLFLVFKSNWYWFVCSLIVCSCLSIIYLIRAPKIYERTATVMIQGEDHVLNGEFVHSNKSVVDFKNTIGNEISLLQSNRLMTQTVRRLNLDMSYTIKAGLRTVELYNHTPILLYFPDIKEYQSYTLKAKLLPQKKVQLWDFEMNGVKDRKMVIIQLNETIDTPFGTLVVTPTSWYEEKWIESTITVQKSALEKTIDHFYHAVNISLAYDQSSVIRLSMKDVSALRAEDVLNTLITVYIEESADYKKQIAVHTEKFINKRISLLREGIRVEQNIDQRDDEVNITGSQEVLQLQHQYAMANYIKTYLNNPAENAELLPAVGIEDAGIERLISFYNQQLLKRSLLTQSAEDNIQIIKELNHSLDAMKINITKMIDHLLASLDVQIQETVAQEQLARSHTKTLENPLIDMGEQVNQQHLQEGLYQYLLQKREENALNKSLMDNSIRHIDDAFGSPHPVAPQIWLVFLCSTLLSILVPGILLALFGHIRHHDGDDH